MRNIPACLVLALFFASAVHAQGREKAQPASTAHTPSVIKLPVAVAREFTLSAKDFAAFRDPQWSALTLAQIGAATADAVTSMNTLNHCSVCSETGPSHIFVGRHPDLHKYVIAGIVEISAEAGAAHYFRRR